MAKSRTVYLLFRNDDLCALSHPEKERLVFRLFEKYSIPQVVGVIPKVTEDQHDCLNQSFHPLNTNHEIVSLLKEYHSKGLIEIAQHGLTHRTNTRHFSLYPRITDEHFFQGMNRKWLANHAARKTYSEFNGLSEGECRSLIFEGKTMLEEIFGISLKTFVFPWNSFDMTALRAVRDCGFKNVCCGQSYLRLNGINTIRYYHWDHLKVSEFFDQIKGLQSDILTQFTYHSWMLSDKDQEALDIVLRNLANRKDVRFFLPGSQLSSIPKAKRILSFSAKVGTLSQRAGRYQSRKLWDYPFYVLDESFYLKRWLCAMIVLFPVEILGIKRCGFCFIAMAGLLIVMIYLFNRFTVWMIPEILAMMVFSGVLVFMWQNRRHFKWITKGSFSSEIAFETGEDKGSPAGMTVLMPQVYAAPMNRKLAEAFIQSYEKLSGEISSINVDCRRYLQLRTLHRDRDHGAFNAIADDYFKENKKSLAFMCWVESLRLNPQQEEVFEKAMAIRNQVSPKIPECLSGDDCLVSVIMPTYNRVNRLNESLMSLKNQTLRDFEVIIVNDGGDADVKACLQMSGLENVQYIDLPVNQGVSAVTNLAIRRARGKYIAYLDDDDIYYPDYLAVMTAKLKATGVPLVYANTYILNGRVEHGQYKAEIVEDLRDVHYQRDLLLKKNMISQVALVHEKDVFRKVGLVNEDMMMSQDLDFWLRCALVYPFHHIPVTLSEYRRSDDSSVVRYHVEKCFFSELLRKHYSFYQGVIAFLKCGQIFGRKQVSEEMFETIRSRYKSQFQSEKILRELMVSSSGMKDWTFQKQLRMDLRKVIERDRKD